MGLLGEDVGVLEEGGLDKQVAVAGARGTGSWVEVVKERISKEGGVGQVS